MHKVYAVLFSPTKLENSEINHSEIGFKGFIIHHKNRSPQQQKYGINVLNKVKSMKMHDEIKHICKKF